MNFLLYAKKASKNLLITLRFLPFAFCQSLMKLMPCIAIYLNLTHDGKDDDDCEHGGEAVGESHNDGVPHAVVVGRVVRRIGNRETIM